MDAFYASVELLRRPELRGLPVAIGGRGDPQSRGVVTTATYAARAFGIRSGMALRTAQRLCPQCIFLPTDFDRYREYSRRFKAAVRTIAPTIEDRGIDEIYIELTGLPGVSLDRGRGIARQLQQAVFDATDGLTCSIGVAPNKLLAKLASEFDKPNGITLLEADDLQTIVWPLPARKLNGIGPKADEKLKAMGIETIGQIAQTRPAVLVARFGRSYGDWLHRAAWGRDERALVTQSEPVSSSRETTFERDMHLGHDRAELVAILTDLASRLAGDLARRHYGGATIGIKLRYTDFSIVTRDLSLAQATNDAARLLATALVCLDRVEPRRRIRLIGIRAGALSKLADDLPVESGDTGPQSDGAPLMAVERTRNTRSNHDPYTPDLFGFDE